MINKDVIIPLLVESNLSLGKENYNGPRILCLTPNVVKKVIDIYRMLKIIDFFEDVTLKNESGLLLKIENENQFNEYVIPWDKTFTILEKKYVSNVRIKLYFDGIVIFSVILDKPSYNFDSLFRSFPIHLLD